MKRLALAFVFLMEMAHAETAEQIFNKVAPSVVTVSIFDELNHPVAEGSGVVIAPTQVMTNCHVTEDAKLIKIKTFDRHIYEAKLLRGDISRDLCLLEVKGLKTSSVRLRSDEIGIGEKVYAVGNPLGLGLSTSEGLISYKLPANEKDKEHRLITNAVISPGSSGGGLFDKDGQLIGITAAIIQSGQNINLALPVASIEYVKKFGSVIQPPPADVPPDRDWFAESEALRVKSDWNGLRVTAKAWCDAYPTSADAASYFGFALYKLGENAEAIKILTSVTERVPMHRLARIYLAQAKIAANMFDAAMVDIKRAIELDPASYYPWFVLAEFYKGQGMLKEARDALTKAIRLSPEESKIWAMLGEVDQRESKFDDAIQNYRTSLRMSQDNPATRENLALLLASKGSSTNAETELSKSTSVVNPKSYALTLGKIGSDYLKERRFDEAEKSFKKAVAVDPESVESWTSLGWLFVATNRRIEAEKAFRKVLEINPNYVYAMTGLAGVLMQKGENVEALKLFEQASIINPQFLQAWQGLSVLRQANGDWNGAQIALEASTKLDPNLVNEWVALGQIYSKSGRDNDALNVLEKAEKLAPDNMYVLQTLAGYYVDHNDNVKSLAYTDRVLQVNSGDEKNWNNKGYALLKMKRFSEAIEAFETALRLKPDFPPSMINLGATYLQSKDLGKAITVLQKSILLAPKANDALIYLAQAYATIGQFSLAKEQAEKVLVQLPNNFPALYISGISNIALGNTKEALADYAKLQALDPQFALKLKAAERQLGSHAKVKLPD